MAQVLKENNTWLKRQVGIKVFCIGKPALELMDGFPGLLDLIYEQMGKCERLTKYKCYLSMDGKHNINDNISQVLNPT